VTLLAGRRGVREEGKYEWHKSVCMWCTVPGPRVLYFTGVYSEVLRVWTGLEGTGGSWTDGFYWMVLMYWIVQDITAVYCTAPCWTGVYCSVVYWSVVYVVYSVLSVVHACTGL